MLLTRHIFNLFRVFIGATSGLWTHNCIIGSYFIFLYPSSLKFIIVVSNVCMSNVVFLLSTLFHVPCLTFLLLLGIYLPYSDHITDIRYIIFWAVFKEKPYEVWNYDERHTHMLHKLAHLLMNTYPVIQSQKCHYLKNGLKICNLVVVIMTFNSQTSTYLLTF